MDLAARLRANARRSNERRVLVLAGDPVRTRSEARAAIGAAGIDDDAVTVLGDRDIADWERLEQRRARELLGRTRTAVVVDCHDECRPNALGAGVGAVDGGGLLLLLTPPVGEWPDRRDAFDATLAVPPFELDAVTGHFRRRLIDTLRQHRGIGIVDVANDTVRRDGIVDAAPRRPSPSPTHPDDAGFPSQAYTACRTQDQASALATLEKLREPETAVVLEADRGRGKSSAAGLAAASLALEGTDVLVTANTYRNAAAVFERAVELLTDMGELAGREPADAPRRVVTETGRVRFAPPDEARTLPRDPDCVVVDEAAGLPVRVLTAFLDAPRAVFATTVHGYEGAGRGFAVRFRDRLADSSLEVHDCQLATPIRFAPADPVEVWAFRALALDARPAVDPLVADATPASVTYRRIDPIELLEDDHLLREAFGLLVLAHYRTEPNDLARLLDAPNIATRALLYDGHVAAVALLAREGGLSADRRARMYAGERVKGNMLPDVLTSQLRDEAAGEPVGQRVLRIATHPAVRSRGLGSHLLEEIRAEWADEVDWLGVGYGMTPELVSFWRSNGFSTVHISTTRNDVSGEHSSVMLDPLSAAGRDLRDRHTAWLLERLPGMLADPLDDVDQDVIREALRSIHGVPSLELSEWEWRVVAGLPSGAAIFDTAPAPFRTLALRHLVAPTEPDLLDAREERLLVRKALQAHSWGAVAEALDYHSHSTCMRAFGAVVWTLVDTYGSDIALAERRRLE